MEKVENIKRPLRKGEYYLVPCIIREENNILFITPVFNHPHSDKENGQREIHYHADYRFIKCKGSDSMPIPINKHSKHYFVENSRPVNKVDGKLEYFILPVINEKFKGITPSFLINKKKLNNNCIQNNRCPHRGYDLSQVSPDENGTITCPLHGLRFNAKTKKLIYENNI